MGLFDLEHAVRGFVTGIITKLVQGFRGLNRETQELLLDLVPELVIGGRGASVIVDLRRALPTIGKDAAHDIENLKTWAREADVVAARHGLPVQIPSGGAR